MVAGTFAIGAGPASAAAKPKDDPARGLRFNGLERATEGPCKNKFEIRSNGELLGYLGISQGTLSWQPKYGPRRHIEWEDLAQVSEDWPEW